MFFCAKSILNGVFGWAPLALAPAFFSHRNGAIFTSFYGWMSQSSALWGHVLWICAEQCGIAFASHVCSSVSFVSGKFWIRRMLKTQMFTVSYDDLCCTVYSGVFLRYTFPTIKHAAMENDHRLDLQPGHPSGWKQRERWFFRRNRSKSVPKWYRHISCSWYMQEKLQCLDFRPRRKCVAQDDWLEQNSTIHAPSGLQADRMWPATYFGSVVK